MRHLITISRPILQNKSVLARSIVSRSYSQTTQQAAHQPDPMHGSYHWIYERALSVATLGACGAAFVVPGSAVNMALGVLLPLHCHVGFGAIITDYLPARKFPKIYIVARSLLYIGTVGTAYGLYLYNTTDVGICEGVRTVWKAKQENIVKE